MSENNQTNNNDNSNINCNRTQDSSEILRPYLLLDDNFQINLPSKNQNLNTTLDNKSDQEIETEDQERRDTSETLSQNNNNYNYNNNNFSQNKNQDSIFYDEVTNEFMVQTAPHIFRFMNIKNEISADQSSQPDVFDFRIPKHDNIKKLKLSHERCFVAIQSSFKELSIISLSSSWNDTFKCKEVKNDENNLVDFYWITSNHLVIVSSCSIDIVRITIESHKRHTAHLKTVKSINADVSWSTFSSPFNILLTRSRRSPSAATVYHLDSPAFRIPPSLSSSSSSSLLEHNLSNSPFMDSNHNPDNNNNDNYPNNNNNNRNNNKNDIKDRSDSPRLSLPSLSSSSSSSSKRPSSLSWRRSLSPTSSSITPSLSPSSPSTAATAPVTIDRIDTVPIDPAALSSDISIVCLYDRPHIIALFRQRQEMAVYRVSGIMSLANNRLFQRHYGQVKMLEDENVALKLYITLNLFAQGTISISVIDSLIVVHNFENKISMIYDIKASSLAPLAPPMPIGNTACISMSHVNNNNNNNSINNNKDLNNNNNNNSEQNHSSKTNPECLYTHRFQFILPNLILDRQQHRVHRIRIDLSRIELANMKNGLAVIEFLFRRRRSKRVVLHTLRDMIAGTSYGIGQSVFSTSRSRGTGERLRLLGWVFHMFNKGYVNALDKTNRIIQHQNKTERKNKRKKSPHPNSLTKHDRKTAAPFLRVVHDLNNRDLSNNDRNDATEIFLEDCDDNNSNNNNNNNNHEYYLNNNNSNDHKLKSRTSKIWRDNEVLRVFNTSMPSTTDGLDSDTDNSHNNNFHNNNNNESHNSNNSNNNSKRRKRIKKKVKRKIGLKNSNDNNEGQGKEKEKEESLRPSQVVFYPVIDQKDVFVHVFSFLDEKHDQPSNSVNTKYFIGVVLEYISNLHKHGIPVEHYLQSFLINLLVKTRRYHRLHQYIQYHVINESLPVALQLLCLEHKYPPAFQLSIDMLSRLKHFTTIVEILLSKGHLQNALQVMYRHHITNVPYRRVLTESLHPRAPSDDRRDDRPDGKPDKLMFYNAFQILSQLNHETRGSSEFLPEDNISDFMEQYREWFGNLPPSHE